MTARIIESTEIAFRADFPLLCNARGLKVAVEVGTDRGVFAREFLSRWHGEMIHLVDDYLPYDEMPNNRHGDLMTAVAGLASYHGRFKFVMDNSLHAAKHLPDWFKPQFIYIDGNHSYEAVIADIEAWWPKLGPDGILAGHDFDDRHSGVVRAVTEFAARDDRVVRVTMREGSPSWYVYRTEPRTLMRRFFDEAERPNPEWRV